MGTTLHAIVEFQTDGKNWQELAQFHFGKDYDASAVVHLDCSEGWPDDLDCTAADLKKRDFAEDMQWCLAGDVPEPGEMTWTWFAFVNYCDALGSLSQRARVLFYRQ